MSGKDWKKTPGGLLVPGDVEPADLEPKPHSGWVVYEEVGLAVSKEPDGFPICDENGLIVGDTIYVRGFFGGLLEMKVEIAHGYQEMFCLSPDGMTGSIAEFGKDDRGCWTISGFLNMRAVKRLGL